MKYILGILSLLVLTFCLNTIVFAHGGVIHETEEEARLHELGSPPPSLSQEQLDALSSGEGFGAILPNINQDEQVNTKPSTETASLVPQEEPSTEAVIPIHFFGRDDCKFCKAEKEFLDQLATARNDFEVIWYDVLDDEYAAQMFNIVTKRSETSKITPITVIGFQVFQGFDSPETSGVRFEEAIDYAIMEWNSLPAHERDDFADIERLVLRQEFGISFTTGKGCDESGTECTVEGSTGTFFNLPFFGPTDLETFSLLTLSAVLGFIDGFNPCAMWVLITFLLILLQIGDRKKMFIVAGTFIVAEAVMYNLILNVWYQTWDFVKLDSIVTPLVGLLAIGGGLFFLYRYYKERQSLVCDTTDLETQGKVTEKIKKVASGPMGIAAILGIIGIAFSVNIIEFACSIGIPQAYTKILELNGLDFLMRQFYIAIYTLFYMIDDFIVFGIALYGFNKLHQSGGKYIRLSLLIGGILMFLLGALLLFNPAALVF